MYTHRGLYLWTLVALSFVSSMAFPMQRHGEPRLARGLGSTHHAHPSVGLPALSKSTTHDSRDRRNQFKRAKGSFGRIGRAAGHEVKTMPAQSTKIKRTKPVFTSSSHTLQLRYAKQENLDIHPLMYFQQHLVCASTKLLGARQLLTFCSCRTMRT